MKNTVIYILEKSRDVPGEQEEVPTTQFKVEDSYAGLGATDALSRTGAEFSMVISLDETAVPEELPSLGVTEQATTSFLSNWVPVRVWPWEAMVTPLTDHA